MNFKSLSVLMVSFFSSVTYAEPVLYSIVDIGPVFTSGYDYQDLKFRINDNNDVVGWSRKSGVSNAPRKAFFWNQSGGLQWIDNGDNIENAALDINNHGRIVGWKNDASGKRQATFWQQDANLLWQAQTPSTVAGSESYFSAINDNGVVAGNYLTADRITQAFTWSEGGSAQLLENNGRYIDVSDIAENYLAGSLVNALEQQVAYKSIPGAVLTELPIIAGADFSVGSGVNNAGVIVGGGSTAADYCSRACFSVIHGLHWDTANVVRDSFAGDLQNSWLESVNSNGVAAGWRMELPSTIALLTEQGAAFDLNHLLVDATGWKLLRAHDVNEAGYIVGYGTYNQVPRAFLLVPGTASANAADLAIAQVFSSTTQKLRERATDAPLSFFFDVKNFGPVSANNVFVESTIPNELNLDSVTISNGACAVDATSEKLTCNIETLAMGETVALTVYVSPQPGDYTFTIKVASVQRDAGVLDNNTAVVSFKLNEPASGNADGAVVQDPESDSGSAGNPEAAPQGNSSSGSVASGSRSGFGCSLRSGHGVDISLLLALAMLVFVRRWARKA